MEFRVLREVAEVIPGTSPKGEFITSDGLGYPFFQGVKEFGTVYPTPERYTEKPIRLAQSGDILFSVRAPVGRTNIATSDCAIGRGVMAIRPNSSQDRNHLLYFLRSIEDKWDSLGSTGSVFESINVSNLRELNVTWPNNRLEASEILWKLDEKIRVNQQISSTLEQIAQTIFKSWFVDFDPVHAKARGEQPVGIDAETVALFPDSFEDSDLGPIPAGWTLCNVESLLKRHSFKSEYKSSEEYGVGSFPIVQQGEPMIAGFGDAEKLLKATPEAPLFVFGDHTCRMMLVNESFVALPNTVVFSSDVGETYWAFHATLGLQKFESYRRHWMELAAKTVVLAPISVQKVFSKTVSTLYQQSWALIHQNRTLEALRDSLLPRLISGELEIPAELLEA